MGYRKNTVIKEQIAASGRCKDRQLVLHRGDRCQLLMNGGEVKLGEARENSVTENKLDNLWKEQSKIYRDLRTFLRSKQNGIGQGAAVFCIIARIGDCSVCLKLVLEELQNGWGAHLNTEASI